MEKTNAVGRKITAIALVAASLALGLIMAMVGFFTTARVSAAGEDIYVIPIDGYYTGEDGASLVLNDAGISLWFTTSNGLHGEESWTDIGADPAGWIAGDSAAHSALNEKVLINGKKFSELNADGAGFARFACIKNASGYCLRIHTDGSFKYTDLESLELLQGFQMYSTNGETLGTGTPCAYKMVVADKPGTNDKMFIREVADGEDALTLKTAPTQATAGFAADDDFNSEGMVLAAKYTDGGTADIEVKARMVNNGAAFTLQQGENTIPVTYNGRTYNYKVTAAEAGKTLASIAVTGTVNVAQYDVPDYSGLTVTAHYVEAEVADEAIDVSKCEFSVVDTWSQGSKQVTVTYRGKSATASITVGAPDKTRGLGFDLTARGKNNQTYSGEVGVMGICIDAKKLGGIEYSGKSIVHMEKVAGQRILEYVEMTNDKGETKTGTELLASNNLKNVAHYGNALIFVTEGDFAHEHIVTMKLKAGFQWVVSDADSFPGFSDGTEVNYYNAPGAVLKEDIYVYNGNTSGWQYALTELAIKDGADYKTEYTQADMSLDLTGLILSYTDSNGASGEYQVTAADVSGFDNETAGEKTITVKYRNKSLTYKINVAAAVRANGIKATGKLIVERYGEIKPDGLTVKYILSDGSEGETVEITAANILFDTAQQNGDYKAKITVGDFNCEADVTVIENNTSEIAGIIPNSVKTGEVSTTAGWGVGITVDGVPSSQQAMLNINNYKTTVLNAAKDGYLTNGDLLLIGDKTFNEVKTEQKKGRLNIYGRSIVIQDLNAYLETNSEITILPGFTWYNTESGSGFYVGNGTNDFNAVYSGNVTALYSYVFTDACYVTLTVKDGEKFFVDTPTAITAVYNSEDRVVIDSPLKIAEVTVTATLKKGGTAEVEKDFCEFVYDFSEAGEKDVTVKYAGKSTTFKVTVSNVIAKALTVKKAPDKTEYIYGFYKVDLTGAEFELVLSVDGKDEKEAISVSELTVDNADPYTLGAQKVKVHYNSSIYAEIDINMVMSGDDYGLYLDGSDGASFSTQLPALKIDFEARGLLANETFKAVWWPTDLEHTFEFIEINGISAAELFEQGLITRLGTYGRQLAFYFDKAELQPTDWWEGSDGNSKKWDDEISVMVRTITVKKGFQWYKPVDGADHWGSNIAEYVKMEGGVLKETFTLYNDNGYGWTRMLAQDSEGNVAADALTIKSQPEKLQYKQGEALDTKGFMVHLKYLDGGEADLYVGASEVEGFRPNVLGEQTLTYTYGFEGAGEATVSFKVTVVEATEDNTEPAEGKKAGCGCGSMTLGSSIMVGVAFIALALCIAVRSKNTDNENR